MKQERWAVVIRDLFGVLGRGLGSLTGNAGGFFEPALRLGVTGLSRAGKTVFITSLVANLMDRARMHGLRAEAEGRIRGVWLQPQPDDTVPRFDYEAHLAALTGSNPHWPESTRSVSELRLSFKLQPGGFFGGLSGPQVLHLDIVDYPGEWILDLPLLDKTYDDWSAEVLASVRGREEAYEFISLVENTDPTGTLDEQQAKALAQCFTDYLGRARAAGYSDCTPGRFLLPGDLAGSPALTFAPLSRGAVSRRGSLGREFERRFEAYKSQVVKPFFRDHFARIDRQIVLVDALGAIHSGPRAVEDMRRSMTNILTSFRPGRTSWLGSLLGTRRVERILFAATKADYLHHTQHLRLTAIMAAMMREAKDRADFAGANTAAMSIAAVRATVEETVRHNGGTLDAVRGRLLETGRQAAFHAGDLPENPAHLLVPAREGAEKWLDADYGVMHFAPDAQGIKTGDGLPHIRLDKAVEFLIGDRL
jgi:predicted YcjX-like family ATPase